ncbi:MAG TPA: hypothetical protein GX745_04200 [Clostridiales bacterium]|nr:hypothetical protein [Clostridiales bacterium]
MLMEIKTNIGTFGNFKDIEIYMRQERHSEINIYAIRAFMAEWEHLTGIYSYNEIKQVSDTKGVLEK